MKRFRRTNVLRRQRIADLRFRAEHDPSYSRLLATELVQQAAEALQASRSSEGCELLIEAVRAFRAPEVDRPGVPDRLIVAALIMLAAADFQDGRLSEARNALLDALEVNRQHDAMRPTDAEIRNEHAQILIQLALVQERLGETQPARVNVRLGLSLGSGGAEPLEPSLRQAASELLVRLGPEQEQPPTQD